jgi:branched-chain amino acid transport system substrate-binding protein
LIIIFVFSGLFFFNKINGNSVKEDDVLRIGADIPLTGNSAVYGESIRDGMELAKEELAKKGINVSLSEDELEEAQLINHMTDYRGGIEYVVRDVAEAQAVSQNIQQWAEKKGFTVVNKKISKSGRVGYFYFRLGENPSQESQKIQGYISQMPSIKHFRFRVRSQNSRPTQPTPDMV